VVRQFGAFDGHSIGNGMATRKNRRDRQKPKFGAGTMILIGSCVALAIGGIFIGAIVIYGGLHAG
jgi:hypothetical protein